MEIKIVNMPLQNTYSKSSDLQYVEFVTEENSLKRIVPNWCVKNFLCRESNGGMNLWFKELERVKPKIVYLYEIRAWKDKVYDHENPEGVDDIIYCVRADFKK